MKVYSDLNTYNICKSVVTLGMFDGVHKGHQKLISSVVNKARELDAYATIVTFWPHPRIVLGKNIDQLRFITTLEEKTKRISELGVDHLILLPFNLELASLSAKEFINQVLIKKIGLVHLIMGYNHRFGNDKLAEFSSYQNIAREFDFGISRVTAVTINKEEASSTLVRNSLESGDVKKAAIILSHPFTLLGTVKGGLQLGRTIGFPTANLQLNDPHKIVPKLGVYACMVRVTGKKFGGMLNIGYRPTVDETEKLPSIEIHIFDFNQDIYSEEIEVEFIDRIRDEKKFENVEALKSQLQKDEKSVRRILKEYN